MMDQVLDFRGFPLAQSKLVANVVKCHLSSFVPLNAETAFEYLSCRVYWEVLLCSGAVPSLYVILIMKYG
jgi:hypothetical protein